MIRGTWTVFRRELAGLFFGPLAWVLLCVALLVNGYFFTLFVRALQGDVTLSVMQAQGGLSFLVLMVLLPPLLTMRMISEEARTGTLEFLLTAPVSDLGVVLGKLLAGTCVMALLWSSALVYGVTLDALGAAPDWGQVLSALLGAVLLSGLLCSVGLVTSAGTGTPLLAAFLAFIANVALISLPSLAGFLGVGDLHWVARVLAELDVLGHYQTSFLTGLLDSRQLVFLLSWTAFFVFLATRVLETRRWRT